MKNFNISALQEVPISKEVMSKLLSKITPEIILVGGQALAYWVEHYNINPNDDEVCISRDADFLGNREHVKLLAQIISGTVDYPPQKALTILCGQVFVINNKTYMNIDVIHRIGNMDSSAVKRRAVMASIQENNFFVMHPLDVLVSRLENYRGIKEKQNANGLRQIRLSIIVAKSYIEEAFKRNEKVAIKAIEKVAEVARSVAGAYARKDGVEIYDVLDLNFLTKSIKNENFISTRIPKLISEMAAVNHALSIDHSKRRHKP